MLCFAWLAFLACRKTHVVGRLQGGEAGKNLREISFHFLPTVVRRNCKQEWLVRGGIALACIWQVVKWWSTTYQGDLLVRVVLLKQTCQPGSSCKIPRVAEEKKFRDCKHTLSHFGCPSWNTTHNKFILWWGGQTRCTCLNWPDWVSLPWGNIFTMKQLTSAHCATITPAFFTWEVDAACKLFTE